ncbi:FecR family protein [Aquimarina gracilis]|uniref:FecR family protein n=1 Tax=Aquimarina gracilis TaxID=874422 RepID=A0ABU5ZSE5_9FLAO|nr:FecR family protein [Aquimarina gracilis]MEB3344492.1 FecR family protein [Aquimarina gracilis]
MDKEYLVKKWLLDDLTDEELNAFKQLDDYTTHIKILEGAGAFKSPVDSEIADINAFYARINNQKEPTAKTIWYIPFLRLAAMIVVLLGIGSLFFLNKTTNVETQISEKITLELPDASTVTLNSKSELAYSKNKWKNDREVNLKGEAFFKVTKGSTFDVITNSSKVSVLGTQFNVKNRKGFFEVQCFEGLVKVQYEEHEKNLPAGSTFTVINGVVTSSQTQVGAAPNWVNNMSTFKSVPFIQVIKEFERQYDVVFSLEKVNTSRIFTGGFVHTSLEDGLKSITLPLDLIYKIDSENRITLFKNEQ